MAESALPRSGSDPVLSGRRAGLLILIGLGSIGLLVWLGGGSTVFERLLELDGRLVGLSLLVHYAGFALRIERWRRILKMLGYAYSYTTLAGLLLSGWFLSALLPARAGDFARIAALRGGTSGPSVSIADSAASLLIERILDVAAILVLALLFALSLFGSGLPGGIGAAYTVGFVLLFLAGLTLALAPRALKWLSRRLSRPEVRRLLDFMESFLTSTRTLGQRPGRAVLYFAQSLLIWLCDGALLWLILAALQNPIGFVSAGFVALTVDLSAAVPLTPGGVGQIEAVYVALLTLLALPTGVAPTAVLVTRSVSYWSFLIVSGTATFLSGAQLLGQVRLSRLLEKE